MAALNWRDLIRGKKELPQADVIKPPPEIDFSELWKEPEDGGSLIQILTIANTALLVIVLIAGFFGK